jgi:hypothetical protein
MGFHATISAGQDVFGNERHKSAPRVRVSERVTGTAQQAKFDRLAGHVVTFQGMPGITHETVTETATLLAMALSGRKITDMTAVMSDWRKVSSTKFELTLRGVGGKLVTRKSNTKTFKGWITEYITPGQAQKIECARVPKGSAIETNGERMDACRSGMNVLQLILRAMA